MDAPTCRQCADRMPVPADAVTVEIAEPAPSGRAVPAVSAREAVTVNVTGDVVVIYVRLSRDSDDSTSVESQRDICRTFAEARGWEVAEICEDVDVSGATPLEDRPGMARVLEYLATGRVRYVLAWKLDRFARSMIEFGRFLAACDAGGSEAVTTDGVLAPGASRMAAKIMATVAEIERDMITDRIRTMKERLRKRGAWPGGIPPYGYAVESTPDGKRLIEDTEAAARVRDIVSRVIDGERVGGIVDRLNAEGVPSPAAHARIRQGKDPRNKRTGRMPVWTATALKDLLTSPALTGTLMHNVGTRDKRVMRPVLDEQGRAVKVGPALITDRDHVRVCEVIESRATPQGKRATDTMLLHVATCHGCGGYLTANARKDRPGVSLYRCTAKGCEARASIQNTALEPFVVRTVLARFGMWRPLVKVAEVADVSAEIARDTAAVESLSEALGKLPAGGPAWNGVMAQLTATNERLAVLTAQQEAAGTADYAPGPLTLSELWERAETDADRRELLREWGVTAEVWKASPDRRDVARRVKLSITMPHAMDTSLESDDVDPMEYAA
ncbi:recombinase family protein [Spirillospora sp. NPDC048832]